MKLTFPKKESSQQIAPQAPLPVSYLSITVLASIWELLPILLLTAFLRLYRLDTTAMMEDGAVLFRMAHDAIAHGLWPLTGNKASIGPLNPPLFTYILLLPAAISSNPIAGDILVSVCNIIAVALAYLFTRRYYGRLAATITALLYAASASVLVFTRDIWQPDLIPLFGLCLMFALFRGVVDRRGGWFGWAVILLAILYQLHGSTIYLAISLLTACFFAFKTLRWRDLFLAAVVSVILLVPFLFLELRTNFADVLALFTSMKSPTHIDMQALHFYQFFLSPNLTNPYTDTAARFIDTHVLLAGTNSIMVTTRLRHLAILFSVANVLMPFLLIGGGLTSLLLILRPGPATHEKNHTGGYLRAWLADFSALPERQGLVLLLTWQVVPLILLLNHSIVLYTHYFIFFIPGQFILIGLFLSKSYIFLRGQQALLTMIICRLLEAITILILFTQLLGSVTYIIDITHGNFDAYQVYPAYYDLASFQHAFAEADQIAQQRHIQRIYIDTAFPSGRSMMYLSEMLQTPSETVDTWHCVVLPSPDAGPALFLASPDNPIVETMLKTYTTATLLAQPARLGGSPFQLFLVQAKPEPVPVPDTFTRNLQLLSPAAQPLQSSVSNQLWLTTRWRVTNTQPPATRVTHTYNFQIQSDAPGLSSDDISCSPTATWAGDQILAAQEFDRSATLPTYVSIRATTFTTEPQQYQLASLTAVTFNDVNTPATILHTQDGMQHVTLPTAPG